MPTDRHSGSADSTENVALVTGIAYASNATRECPPYLPPGTMQISLRPLEVVTCFNYNKATTIVTQTVNTSSKMPAKHTKDRESSQASGDSPQNSNFNGATLIS